MILFPFIYYSIKYNVKLQQRHLEDIYEKLVHSMPITMQCGGNPQNNPTLTANNSGLKSSKLENYNIFGILGEVILVEIIENNAFSFHESN